MGERERVKERESVCERVCVYSCLILCDPLDSSLSGSSVHGIFQARILEWVSISSSRGSSPLRDRTHVSFTADRFFTTEPLVGQCSGAQGWTPDHQHHQELLRNAASGPIPDFIRNSEGGYGHLFLQSLHYKVCEFRNKRDHAKTEKPLPGILILTYLC